MASSFSSSFSAGNRRDATTAAAAAAADTSVNTTGITSTSRRTMSGGSSTSFPLWEFPEALLYNIVSFVALPTHRAQVLCHQIAPLCKASRRSILVDEERSVLLWDAVLVGDYGVNTKNRNGQSSSSSTTTRRSCKRLKRSPCHQVRDAHKMMKDNTEIAFFYLSEMAHASGKKAVLSRRGLCSLLDEYGPHLRLNYPVSSGGVFLVEVCRARNVKENIILKCVEELVESRGAHYDLDIHTYEAKNSTLTALCVAAVRGMPTVVRYLLKKGASPHEKNSGRFKLSVNPRKSIRCTDATALEFAKAMHQTELDNGATNTGDLNNLNKSIRLLEQQQQEDNKS